MKCNFCMGDLGRNGIADLKHEKPPAGPNFRPRALRALGRKLEPLGGFSCLRSAIPFLPTSPMQKLPISLRTKLVLAAMMLAGPAVLADRQTKYIAGVWAGPRRSARSPKSNFQI